VALPALVHGAFTTTWPVHVFAMLVAYTLQISREFPSFLGVTRYAEHLRNVVESESSIGRERPKLVNTEADALSLLGGETQRWLAQFGTEHPLGVLVQDLWGQPSDGLDGAVLRGWLLEPAQVFERGGAIRD
jgi:hypothetical protein